jgi:hypothetical protein
VTFHWLSNTVEKSRRCSRNYTPFIKAAGLSIFSPTDCPWTSVEAYEHSTFVLSRSTVKKTRVASFVITDVKVNRLYGRIKYDDRGQFMSDWKMNGEEGVLLMWVSDGHRLWHVLRLMSKLISVVGKTEPSALMKCHLNSEFVIDRSDIRMP